MAATTANISWNTLSSRRHISQIQPLFSSPFSRNRPVSVRVRAFRRSDFDRLAQRVASGDAWKDAWRSANYGFEQLLFDASKTVERLDRRYSLSLRMSTVARSASERALQLDRRFEVSNRWKTFSLDFSRNWPRYKKQLDNFFKSPLGRSFTTIFFLWFTFSGWLLRFFLVATFVLPFAGPLLLGTVANNFIVQGNCPACKRRFVGNKSRMVSCMGCGNTVWQPQEKQQPQQRQWDFFSRGGTNNKKSNQSKSQPEIIDVEFEEK